MLKRFLFALFIALAFATRATAQEVEVERYQITARVDAAASAIDARATLNIANLGQSPKAKLYFRLTKLAKVSAATVNGATAQVETIDDRRTTTLNQIILTLASPVAAGASARVEISYRLEAPESSPLIHIYPGEVLLAPDAVWVPMPSTVFTIYGPTTAPFTLDISLAAGATNFRAVSAGTLKTSGANVTFEQSLNSLPLLIAGNFDAPTSFERGGINVEIYAQPGLTSAADPKTSGRAIITRLGDEAGRAIDFFTKTLGPPPAGATFRIISSVRASNISVPGALVLNEQVFRRDTLTAANLESLADAMARLWTDGRVRVRGQEARAAAENRPAQKPRSAALLRDSLPRYLAALYVEERFGKDAFRDTLTRWRWSYTSVAQAGRDAELAIQTISLPNYAAAVFAKGPLVLRMLAERMGRDQLLDVIKATFTGAPTRIVTPEDFRAALVKASPDADKIFQQWVDAIIEPDIIVGAPLPSDKPGAQRVNLRNLGTGDVTVTVVAVTVSGKQVTTSALVPSENITSAEIPTAEKITAIEVDPEKLIIQTNYDNDARDGDMKTAHTSAQTLFNQSVAAFNKGDYTDAETKLRQAARIDPHNSLLHAWLARSLGAQKKYAEAVSEANATIKLEPADGSALAWARITIGQAALARNQAAEAVPPLRLAAAEAEEAPTQFAARDALIQAERAAGLAPPIEASVRAFITQLDGVIKDPSQEKLQPFVIKNNLKRFAQGLNLLRPTAWATEILRADQIDANRVALDVELKVKAESRDQSGTARYVLCRAASGWVLEDVQLFNVK